MTQTQSDGPLAASQTGKGATGRNPTDPKNDPADSKNPKNGASTTPETDPTELLKSDHRQVEQLFRSFDKTTDAETKAQLAAQICIELMVHTLIEEEIFYPACKGQMDQRLLDEAQVEHDGAKTLIMEIQAGSPDEQYFDAKVKVLSEEIKHHVQEEEKSDGTLAKAKAAGVVTSDLAQRIAARKQELMEKAEAGDLGPPKTRSFRVRTNAGTKQLSQEHEMSRGSTSTMERERDERGRFISEDDDDRDYRRHSSSRSRHDDDDRRRSTPARDDEGRFVSSRSRYDEDDYRRGGRGHGGWYGDPEGHSEASRRGWEEREGYRARSRDEYDDRRRAMPARDDEGRFTTLRSRYDEDDYRRGGRGHGGWYGDPEGHSEASRRGWEEREGYRARSRDDDDDRRRGIPARDDEGRFTSSRSRYDDHYDDDRGRSRGHGGWYGDPEGHSRAARGRR